MSNIDKEREKKRERERERERETDGAADVCRSIEPRL